MTGDRTAKPERLARNRLGEGGAGEFGAVAKDVAGDKNGELGEDTGRNAGGDDGWATYETSGGDNGVPIGGSK